MAKMTAQEIREATEGFKQDATRLSNDTLLAVVYDHRALSHDAGCAGNYDRADALMVFAGVAEDELKRREARA